MHISIILSTWNNYRRLSITLSAIAECIVPKNIQWQLVLINNNCTDQTSAIVNSFKHRLPITYLEEPRQGLSRAKNTGLKVATGRLLIFTDDDIYPSHDWISAYWNAYQDKPEGYYFGGPIDCEYESGTPDDNFLAAASYSITGLDWGPINKTLSDSELFLSANWACPAKYIESVGGYNENLGLDPTLGIRRVGEEFDLMDRLQHVGLRGWYLPRCRVTHFVPEAKCNAQHIGDNAQAQGAYSVQSKSQSPFLYRRPELKPWCSNEAISIGGVPLPLCVKSMLLALQWAFARARGKKGYRDYTALRFCLGRILGYRERHRAN
ncbi:MAG: glycosyltransferase [Gammaproteobacteria bacterium]|nr:glycosyltransferase [Gammaproteobacteria bacterium]